LLKKIRANAIRDSKIHSSAKIESGSQVVNSVFGRHTFCGYDCTLLNVDIGPFCSISDQVYVGGNGHPMQFVSTSPVFLSHKDSVRAKFASFDYFELPRTEIGADVWIGFGARIRAGVSVGTGAVVGMGAVVTNDVEPYSVVAGSPARQISMRFSAEIASKLLASRWWEFDDKSLSEFGQYFDSPERFLAEIELR